MALRVRTDGRVLCAAKHPALPGDCYIDDGVHYLLSVEQGVVVPARDEDLTGRWHFVTPSWRDRFARWLQSYPPIRSLRPRQEASS